MPAPTPALHRTILVVDIEASTTRTNPGRATLRAQLYRLLASALQHTGIDNRHCDPLVDRGDGVLILIQPVDQIPKMLLLNTLIPILSDLLATHNQRRSPRDRFRLRAGMHAGEVHYDTWGPFGEAIDITCRLTDATAVKTTLATTTAPLVLVVSEDIYRSVIRHGYQGIDDRTFAPLVRQEIGSNTCLGWVHIPRQGWY